MTDTDLMAQFLKHRDTLWAFLLGLTRDHGAAEEILQQLGLQVIVEAAKDRPPENFSAWVRALARHRVADYYREQSRRRAKEQSRDSLDDLVVQAFDENADAVEDHQRRIGWLMQCLLQLTARTRRMLDLFYGQRQPIRAIAQVLGWREASIKVSLSKSRQALRRCIEKKRAKEGVW